MLISILKKQICGIKSFPRKIMSNICKLLRPIKYNIGLLTNRYLYNIVRREGHKGQNVIGLISSPKEKLLSDFMGCQCQLVWLAPPPQQIDCSVKAKALFIIKKNNKNTFIMLQKYILSCHTLHDQPLYLSIMHTKGTFLDLNASSTTDVPC